MKKLWRSKVATVGALALALSCGSMVMAQDQGGAGAPGGPGGGGFQGYRQGGGPGQWGPHRGPGAFGILRQLNLTPDQQQKLHTIFQQNGPQMRQLMQQMRQQRQQLNSLTHQTPFNDGQAQTLAKQLGQTFTQLSLLRARLQSQLWATLTPDQQAKWTQIEQQMRQRRQQWMQNHPHPGRPGAPAAPAPPSNQ